MVTTPVLNERPRAFDCTRQFQLTHRLHVGVASASATLLVLCVLAFAVPQGAYSDPGWQLKAVQQNLRGESPSANSLVSPNPEDLTTNVSGWISWWAPGTEVFVWPLMALRLSPGSAVRIIAAACVLLGSIGWAMWISFFNIPRWASVSLCAFLPWMQYVHNSLFLYSAEALVFAAVPWALFAGARVGQTTMLQSAAAGLLVGGLYVLKYSAVFVSAGVVLFVLREAWWSQRLYGTLIDRRRMVRCACIFLLATGAPIIGLSVVNRMAGAAMNLVTASPGIHLRPETLLFAAANPVLIMGADAPLRYVLLHPTRGLLKGASEVVLGFAGLPGGIVLLLLILTQRPAHKYGEIARAVLFGSMFCLIVVWTVAGTSVSYEARHMAGAGLAVMPYALEKGFNLYTRRPRRAIQMLLMFTGICYIAVPSLYGVAAATGKFRRQSDQIAGSSGMYNPLLAAKDISTATALLLEGFNPRTDLWYVTDPITALDLPGRALIRHADFIDPSQLRKETFRTSSPLRVRLVLPKSFEENGKGEIIRNSFVAAGEWQACQTDGVTRCWTSLIQPLSARR
jgi:hypothetical protein